MAIKREFGNPKYITLHHNEKFDTHSFLRVENNIQYLLDTEYGEGNANGDVETFINDIARHILKFFRREMDNAIEKVAPWDNCDWFMMTEERIHYNTTFREISCGDTDDLFHLFYYGMDKIEIAYYIRQLKKNFRDYACFKKSEFNVSVEGEKYKMENFQDTMLNIMYYCFKHCNVSEMKEFREISCGYDIIARFSQIVLRKAKYKITTTDSC